MDGTPDDRLLTIPPGGSKRPRDPVKQIPVRVHVHDHTMLRVRLRQDSLTVQKFIGFCIQGYLDADPMMLRMLRNYRELELVPPGVREKHVLSSRERMGILDEIEAAEKGKDDGAP